jgi:hypothetical protein
MRPRWCTIITTQLAHSVEFDAITEHGFETVQYSHRRRIAPILQRMHPAEAATLSAQQDDTSEQAFRPRFQSPQQVENTCPPTANLHQNFTSSGAGASYGCFALRQEDPGQEVERYCGTAAALHAGQRVCVEREDS